ncbi:hypothetical protein L0936_19915 [Paracidovorax citrulli]|uniref:hypothetical protein n=1 Tax=Paracidovorax citrulli TaxID=80869 RepID=UPI000A6F6286|nr:hypothetical protein [Paracidovorax citrulli]UEG47444.1 hypothetical protein LKW27_06130 [Paracidovorax citrulli]
MATKQEEDYWRKVRQDNEDTRRRATAKYTYVPNWVFVFPLRDGEKRPADAPPRPRR